MAKEYRGFAEIDRTPGDNGRYYEYTATGRSIYTTGSNIEIPEFGDASHLYAESGILGGSPGVEEDVGGTPTPGVGETDGYGLTSTTIGWVEQEYQSDISNLVAAGANGMRLRVDSMYLPLELCPVGEWTAACGAGLQENYRSKSPSHQSGLIGYPEGVIPPASAVFADPSHPLYFGTFAVGRYNDANAGLSTKPSSRHSRAGWSSR